MKFILASLLLPLILAGVLPSDDNQDFDKLSDQVLNIADKLRQTQRSTNDAGSITLSNQTMTTRGPAIPGWKNNICVNLCPKWCKLSPGSRTIYTNCHYVCGNICHKQTRNINLFLGNPSYEVVPSSFAFSNYDHNGDKRLSIDEISRTDGVLPDDIRRLFQFADFNYDGFLDHDEFQGGPFVFTVQMAAELTAVARSNPTPTEESDS